MESEGEFARVLAKSGSEKWITLEICGVDIAWACALDDRDHLIKKAKAINAAAEKWSDARVKSAVEEAVKEKDDIIRDLSMICRRMVARKGFDPEFSRQIQDYLKRKGLGGSCLRSKAASS